MRIEDDLSYPGHPFATGVIIKNISAVTIDNEGKIKYIADAEQVLKRAGIEGLTAYFNYSEDIKEVFLEHLTGSNTKANFIKYAREECTGGKINRTVVHPVNIILLLNINKNPKENNQPQIAASLQIGLGYKTAGSTQNYLGFNAELEQIPIAMKLLEYTGMYSQFQTGVLLPYQNYNLTKEQRDKYKIAYREYLAAVRKADKKALEAKREVLIKLEEKFSLTVLKKLRAAERSRIEFEERKEEAKKSAEEKVKILEGQKKSTYSSVKLFFGSSKAKQDKAKAEEQVEKYKESLIKVQEELFEKEGEQLEKELDELFSTTAEVDIKTSLNMPASYERFKFAFEINLFTISVSKGQPDNKFFKMVELSIEAIRVSF